MERSNSFGTSWADQWDYTNPDPYTTDANSKSKADGKSKNGAVEKTKAVAGSGLKKVKAGTTLGFTWIKDKVRNKSSHK